MPYVDGFVVAVPKSKIADYKKLARKVGRVWRENGALCVTGSGESRPLIVLQNLQP